MNQAAIHRLLGQRVPSKNETKKYHSLYEMRLAANLTLLKATFFTLYNEEENTPHFLRLLETLEALFKDRPHTLKKQDVEKLAAGNWYQNEKMVGMQLYVDRFHKNINGIAEKIPYFKELGISFLHLMPITTRPDKENDGGYAVNSYHEVDPRYGTKEDFIAFAKKAREQGLFLMLDFVVNHTSDEYEWAKRAKEGSKKHQAYYYTYPDRQIPDEFEKTLPEIFPESSPGNFTYDQEMDKWVMTCFNSFQWDLNYRNPEVFIEMMGNLMALANMGVDVIRFDALAFLWKKIGTISQNLPEAHTLISLFKMCLQIIAPGVIFLAEAIVAPKNILKYFGEGVYEGNECEIAYNASLMALLWNSIATKKVSLMHKSLTDIHQKPKDATWINYIRCHDDIGLGYDDDFIRAMGWDPSAHRNFLLDYYCKKLDWSPAKGLVFMYNPKNGDGRITGSAASLLGLETALEQKSEHLTKAALAKIIMMHGIILTYPGIPLIYAGDEIGTLNDYTYLNEPKHQHDSRWVNRPRHDWKTVASLEKSKNTPAAIIFYSLKKMIAIRKNNPVFADSNNIKILDCPNKHVFVFERALDTKKVWIFSNFNEVVERISLSWLLSVGIVPDDTLIDLLTGNTIQISNHALSLQAFQQLWVYRS